MEWFSYSLTLHSPHNYLTMKIIILCCLFRKGDQPWLLIWRFFYQQCWSKWVHLALTKTETCLLIPQAIPQHRVEMLNHQSNHSNKPSEVSLACEGLFSFSRQVSPFRVRVQGSLVERTLSGHVVRVYILCCPLLYPTLLCLFLWASSCLFVTSVQQLPLSSNPLIN